MRRAWLLVVLAAAIGLIVATLALATYPPQLESPSEWISPGTPAAGSNPADMLMVELSDERRFAFPRGYIHEGTRVFNDLRCTQYYARDVKTRARAMLEIHWPSSGRTDQLYEPTMGF